jgi:hypothetical protein
MGKIGDILALAVVGVTGYWLFFAGGLDWLKNALKWGQGAQKWAGGVVERDIKEPYIFFTGLPKAFEWYTRQSTPPAPLTYSQWRQLSDEDKMRLTQVMHGCWYNPMRPEDVAFTEQVMKGIGGEKIINIPERF